MKTWISLLAILLLAVAAPAQVPPPEKPDEAAATRSATQEEVEAMRRLLRQAMTNAAFLSTNAPRLSTIATNPSAAGPAGVTPIPTPSPGLGPVPAPILTGPTTLPLPTQTTAAAPSAAPGQSAPITILPGGAAIPPPGGVLGAVAPGQPAATPQPGAPDGASSAPDPNGIIPAGALQVQNMELAQFFDQYYSQYSGRTVLRPNTLQVGQGAAITLKAQSDMTVRDAVFAMNQVLALNGIAMIPIGDKFVTAVPAQIAPAQGGELGNVLPGDYTANQEFVHQMVELKAIKPSEMAQQIQALGSGVPNGLISFDDQKILLIRDYTMNVKRMMEVIKKVDVMPEQEFILEAIPIKYGRVEEFYDTMIQLTSGSGAGGAPAASGLGAQGGRSGLGAAGTRTAGGSRGSSTGNRFGSQNYNQPSYGGSSYPYSGGIRPQQVTTPTPVGAAQSTFNQNLQRLVQNAARGNVPEVQILENARIVPDPRSNQLFIYAHRRDMAMITNIVAKMDVLLAQVLIEAVIFEVSLGDSLNLGVSMVQNPRRFGQDFAGAGVINNGQGFISAATNLVGAIPGMTYFGKIGEDLDVTLQAIAENSTINVISRPRIQTSHAIPGSFFLGQTVPYVTGVVDYGFATAAGASTRSQVQQVSVGFGLDVVPYITPEGYVVMDIQQTFNNLGRDVIIDGNPVPIINDRSASAVLTVKDGQTIMMGGFITQTKSHSKSGVPFLKDIPYLGAAFRSKIDKNDRTELIVLMRARVLHTPEQAAIVAEQEKSQLLGIQEAERQVQKNDAKRSKQAARAEKHK